MLIRIVEESIRHVAELASIPSAFEVRSILAARISGRGIGGILLIERSLETPYRKDYDALEGEGPMSWADRFDVSRWRFFGAYDDGERVGGAVVAFDTSEVTLLEARRDLAVIWDIRVAPHCRGRGVGAALFQAVEEWAQRSGCVQLKVETQNTNVPACKFYARLGCVLGAINRFAYPDLPDEIQLLWYKDLGPRASSALHVG